MSNDELEGRVRALEALVLELITPKQLESAKETLSATASAEKPFLAQVKDKLGASLDEHGENALKSLETRLKSQKRGP